MKHAEAIEEMKALAGGKAWSFTYEIASYKNGPHISGYINLDHPTKGHAVEAHTYAEAIENVKRMLGLVGCDPAPEDTDNA
uniref:Uncharacterized protein n=1 Tax=viral metagenome TaxID=1070528 RepID=A0A6M3ITX5_9ZZZZ